MRGEWWIDTDGTAHYADGDVGDINHENFVVVHCMGEVLDYLRNSDNALLGELASGLESFIEGDGVDIVAVNEFMCNWSDGLHREGRITDDQVNDIYSYIRELSKLDKDLLDVVFDRDKDCRMYGMETLGWIRLAGNCLECYQVTPKAIRQMAAGLWDAYDEEVEMHTYVVESIHNGAWYTDVPYAVFTDASMLGLRTYQRHY